MTAKQKEIRNMMPLIEGKKVDVWIGKGPASGKLPFCEGTVEQTVNRMSKTYLVLKHVLLWNGVWKDEYSISVGTISKIELKNAG